MCVCVCVCQCPFICVYVSSDLIFRSLGCSGIRQTDEQTDRHMEEDPPAGAMKEMKVIRKKKITRP